MAITNRKGPYSDFDASKMLKGEFAIVVSGDPNISDGRAVYICFEPGYIKRLSTFEDIEENIAEAAKGERGSFWYYGTAVTGTSTDGQSFDTGINDALKNDYYLNTESGNIYNCTVGGTSLVAKWAYIGCILGPEGPQGDLTLESPIIFTNPYNYEEQILSGDSIKTVLEKLNGWYKNFSAVVFSGEYNDLKNKPALKDVATSGDYNDLSNKPTIPEEPEDSGWINLPLASGYSNISNYTAQYRKIGNQVELRGAVRNDSSDIGGGTTEVTVGTLPEGYRPSKMVCEIHHAYNYHRYQMRINTNGTVTVSRAISSYQTGGYTDIPSGGTIFLGATFFTND